MTEMDYSKLSNSELLTLATMAVAEIRNSLPKELYAGSFTLESKLPWKAIVFRELLFHRFSDLADSAVTMYETNRTIPAFILTRAVVENTAMMYWFSTKVAEFSETKNEDAFDQFLMKGMFGGRDPESPEESYNILTAVDHIDKLYKGIRVFYNTLSEFAHPNYSGVMGSYSNLDEEKYITYLGKEHANVSVQFGLMPLVVCLEVFIDYYNSTGLALKAINDSYEKNIKPASQ